VNQETRKQIDRQNQQFEIEQTTKYDNKLHDMNQREMQKGEQKNK
jgi:hypothetical protein